MRNERVASLIAREISIIISQDVKDPRLGIVTVTQVSVSPDLKVAKIYFTSLGNSTNDLEILRGAKGFIRSTLAHRIRIKFVPELDFFIDESAKHGEKIDKLLEKIDKENKEK